MLIKATDSLLYQLCFDKKFHFKSVPCRSITKTSFTIARHTHKCFVFCFTVVASSVMLFFPNHHRYMSVSNCHVISSFQRCCDPLKCHTRRRTRNTRSDLRPVSSNLVACFLLLMLSPSHKICSMCRRKLYVMQNTSSSGFASF